MVQKSIGVHHELMDAAGASQEESVHRDHIKPERPETKRELRNGTESGDADLPAGLSRALVHHDEPKLKSLLDLIVSSSLPDIVEALLERVGIHHQKRPGIRAKVIETIIDSAASELLEPEHGERALHSPRNEREKVLKALQNRHKWKQRRIYKLPNDPIQFIEAVYPDRRKYGLVRSDLLILDEPLYLRLQNWLRDNELPEGFDLPTKKQKIDAQVAALSDVDLERLKGTAKRQFLSSGAGRSTETKRQLALYQAVKRRRVTG